MIRIRPGWLYALLLGCTVSGSAAPAHADQTDSTLTVLFERLRAAPDTATAADLEARIWSLWMRSGVPEMDALLGEGVQAMRGRDFARAVEIFGRIIERAPGFAEAWNKRATAYYLDGDYAASMADIQRTLVLEPRHFGAISGMGLIFLERGDEQSALRAFEEVLKIDPHAPGALHQVKRLRLKQGEAI